MQKLFNIFTFIVGALFPQRCAGCNAYGALLCDKCFSSIPRSGASTDPHVTTIFEYQNPVMRNAIWRFKYRHACGFADYFGNELYNEIIGDLGDKLHISKKETFLLVPIPLHKKRLYERGYNQSELLVRSIMRNDIDHLFKYSNKALSRIKKTKPQARSDKRAARLENLRGAFLANSTIVKGKDILLIDDVTTTGATLSEARKALRTAGARSVHAYTVAH